MTRAKETLLQRQRDAVQVLRDRAKQAPEGSKERGVVLECLQLVIRALNHGGIHTSPRSQ